jgi:hypothetical protein
MPITIESHSAALSRLQQQISSEPFPLEGADAFISTANIRFEGCCALLSSPFPQPQLYRAISFDGIERITM